MGDNPLDSSSDSPMDSPSEGPSDISSDSSSESDGMSPSHSETRKRRRHRRRSNYLQGKCKKVYHVNKDLEQSLRDSGTSITGVCSTCASSLAEISDGFKQLKHRGVQLKKRKSSLPSPKVPDRDHYRNVSLQNEWIRGNLFDAMGNYLFCHTCIIKALHISPQRLSRQRKVKRSQFQKPIVRMTKDNVDKEKVNPFVLMPEAIETSMKVWWAALPSYHVVDVRYPHEKHGLTGRVSNNAKLSAKGSFLKFVDNNSQANGRRLDSRNPTHYFFPKFRSISEPKRNVSAYDEKVKSSLVCEFNRAQREAGLGTISSQTALNWLKAERPKTAIYPHQTDYCDYCCKVKTEIQANQQKISRHLQSGTSSVEDIEELKKNKEDLEKEIAEHRKIARESLQYYRDMKQKCAKQWKDIMDLQSTDSSPERDERLKVLQDTFTLLVSVDYQMSKLLPYWGHSAQPSSTYYLQKVSYDIYGLVDHRDESGHLYLLNETIGPKNTDHSISYLMHYLRSSGKVPTWIRRVHVFMDNAGSTNKNQYMMSATLEIIQQNVMDYFRISFMVAGHTKFAPDLLFSVTARDFYASDVFNESELVAVMEKHASIVIDTGRIVRAWRETVTKKYSNLPGIRGLHDFLALRNSGQDALMKVRESCYTGTLKNTPMKISKGMSASDLAIPGVNQSYFALGMAKQLPDSKQSHLNQMCANFIPQDRWHELAHS